MYMEKAGQWTCLQWSLNKLYLAELNELPFATNVGNLTLFKEKKKECLLLTAKRQDKHFIISDFLQHHQKTEGLLACHEHILLDWHTFFLLKERHIKVIFKLGSFSWDFQWLSPRSSTASQLSISLKQIFLTSCGFNKNNKIRLKKKGKKTAMSIFLVFTVDCRMNTKASEKP